jgi:hypothetical protein
VDLDKILYGGNDIKGDLDSILLNTVTSTISKWRTFKLLRWAQLLNCVPVQDGVRDPDESRLEVEHDPDTLASSPDRCKGR